jgi:hypothetical protein
VPEGGDGGADWDVHHIVVEQDLDQSLEGPKANVAIEGQPRIINPVSRIYAIIIAMIVPLRFRSWFETLDAWSLGTSALSLVC